MLDVKSMRQNSECAPKISPAVRDRLCIRAVFRFAKKEASICRQYTRSVQATAIVAYQPSSNDVN